jgi:hypothetical protein
MLRDVIEYMKVHMFDNKYWVSRDGKEEFQPFDFINDLKENMEE